MSTHPNWDTLWIDCNLFTANKNHTLINDAALAIKGDKIAWIGKMQALPQAVEKCAKEICTANGRLVTPGLIDCHTHTVFAGNRAKEFSLRLNGASYESIAKAGGGILSTVRQTREASETTLYHESKARLENMMREGTCCVEIKSGYGLNLEAEIKQLRVIKQLSKTLPIKIESTFLGAHTTPPEFQHSQDYVDHLCEVMIPKIAKEALASAVDVFCESIGFSLEQTKQIFKTASHHQLKVKVHAEQLSELGASSLAAAYSALSVDHLEHLRNETALQALAKSGTIAVLLPGAYYFLRETTLPPIEKFRKYQIPMAIATDCNPGTSPTTSLPLMMNMACTLFRLTPEEALLGTTIHAAQALGIHEQLGSLEAGKLANFVIWQLKEPEELCYYFGSHFCHTRVINGKILSL